MSAAVEATGIAKRYGSLVALEDLTFEAQAGEILGVLGPNGAGKTTAIRILTTILEPTQGTFSIAGVAHTRPAEIRRRMGVVPESAGYPERQTGEEFLLKALPEVHVHVISMREAIAAGRSVFGDVLEPR